MPEENCFHLIIHIKNMYFLSCKRNFTYQFLNSSSATICFPPLFFSQNFFLGCDWLRILYIYIYMMPQTLIDNRWYLEEENIINPLRNHRHQQSIHIFWNQVCLCIIEEISYEISLYATHWQ